MKTKDSNLPQNEAMQYEPLLPAVFSPEDMISFGNFIRDNYYGVGAPKLQSYDPVKYPHGTIEDIFVIWSCLNGR